LLHTVQMKSYVHKVHWFQLSAENSVYHAQKNSFHVMPVTGLTLERMMMMIVCLPYHASLSYQSVSSWVGFV
jgi:EamA domain-containing membrane protein RarD